MRDYWKGYTMKFFNISVWWNNIPNETLSHSWNKLRLSSKSDDTNIVKYGKLFSELGREKLV